MKLESRSCVEFGFMIARDILITYNIYSSDDTEEDRLNSAQRECSKVIRFYLTDDKASWIDKGGIQFGESNFLFIHNNINRLNTKQNILDIIEGVKKTIGDNINERVISYAEIEINHSLDKHYKERCFDDYEDEDDGYYQYCNILADKCEWISEPFVVPCRTKETYKLQINDHMIDAEDFNSVYYGLNAEKFNVPLTPKKEILLTPEKDIFGEE